MKFPFPSSNIPPLSVQQMIEVDNLMINAYHINLLQMMENAGRNLSTLITHRFFQYSLLHKQICVLADKGGNGGWALVCARHLHNHGASLTIVLSEKKENLTSITAHQLDITQRLNIPIYEPASLLNPDDFDLIVDGILGYNIKSAPQKDTATLINFANSSDLPIVSLDIPSGLDPNKGIPYKPTIKASATLTLALPKTGLLSNDAKTFVGELYLADISVPPKLFNDQPFNLNIDNFFQNGYILRIH